MFVRFVNCFQNGREVWLWSGSGMEGGVGAGQMLIERDDNRIEWEYNWRENEKNKRKIKKFAQKVTYLYLLYFAWFLLIKANRLSLCVALFFCFDDASTLFAISFLSGGRD